MKAAGTGDSLVVEVGNRGGPMEAETLNALLNSVATSKSEMKNGSSGLGLGLYIAREIAQAHSGSIEAYSGADKTVFTLTIPRRAGKQDRR